jgi:hypothetical protein
MYASGGTIRQVSQPAGFGSRRPRVIDPPARDHYQENDWSDEDLWRAYDGRYHFIARSSRGMALSASHLMSRAAMLRSASTLNAPQTKQSSTLTGCVGMVATSPAGRRGTGK